MNQQQLDLIHSAIALTVERCSRRFRRLNDLALAIMGAVLSGSVVCLDVWPAFPRWLVYVLTVALVTHALVHTAVIRCFEEGERRAWREFLKYLLPDEVVTAPTSANSAKPVPPNNRPVLRVFRPDEEK